MSFRLTWNADKSAKQIDTAARDALRDGGEVILDESNQIAPIDEGALINSGKVAVSDDSVVVSYDTPYAVRQHEDVTMQHTNGRQAKFLETAYKANQKRVIEYVAKKIKEAA